MALDFPSDITQPYIDPATGLKYIFNNVVGAWETAIQPPAVIKPEFGLAPEGGPQIEIPGFLWYNPEDGNLYIYHDDNWVLISAPLRNRVFVGDDPPTYAVDTGDLWWCSSDAQGGGRLYIYYCDQNDHGLGESCQWMDASPNTGNGEGADSGGGGDVHIGGTCPVTANNGDFCYNPSTGALSIYIQGTGWIVVNDVGNHVSEVTGATPITSTGGLTPEIGIEYATEDRDGSIEIATLDEVVAGTDTTRAVTPAYLKTTLSSPSSGVLPISTETQRGIIEIATKAEVKAGTDDTRAITPKKLKDQMPLFGLGVPTGAVLPFAGESAPDGYLICDGSAINRNNYANLFSIIGCCYGSGNGSSTFNIPDLRGEFIRGLDGGRGVDRNRTLGEAQTDEIRAHTHTMNVGPSTLSTGNTGGGNRASDEGTADIGSYGGNETRPRNLAMNFIIKT
jgi:microcystin-dependent protein